MFPPTGRAIVMKFGLVSLELISILSSAIAFRAEDSRLNLVTPPIINRRWTRFSIWTRFPPSVRPNSGTVLSLLLSVYHPRGWGTFAGLGTGALAALGAAEEVIFRAERSEEHTSELQSRGHLVCRLLLEKKNDAGVYRSARKNTKNPSPKDRNS